MGNSFSTQDLKEKIHQDLKIDVAFPFFPLDRKTGSSACCVVKRMPMRKLCNRIYLYINLFIIQVDTDWIDKLTTDSDNNEHIILRRPGYSRKTNDAGPTNSPSSQKQSPTVNIYVTVLSKESANR